MHALLREGREHRLRPAGCPGGLRRHQSSPGPPATGTTFPARPAPAVGTLVVADARQPQVRPLDIVLLDAPCSGTGTIARHPDARWRVNAEGAEAHRGSPSRAPRQRSCHIVKPGGLLVYSTLLRRAGGECRPGRAFSDSAWEFSSRKPTPEFPPELCSSKEGSWLILPQLHGMDGAYGTRLRRTG